LLNFFAIQDSDCISAMATKPAWRFTCAARNAHGTAVQGTLVGATHFRRMTRYYFHTFDDETPSHLDDVGEDLPTREAAWEMATRYAAECLRDLDGKLRINRE